MAAKDMQTVVEGMPRVAERGILADAPEERVKESLRELVEAGPDAVPEIVAMLVELRPGEDVQARHALHALAVSAGGIDGPRREAVAKAIAAALDGERPKEVQGFLIRQLQVVGGPEVIEALARRLTDLELGGYAAQALVAIGKEAAAALREALASATGSVRVAIVQALGTLRNREAAGALKQLARDEDSQMRQTVLWALANAGSGSSTPLILDAVKKEEGYARTQAVKAAFLLAERLAAAGRKQEAARLYGSLRNLEFSSHEAYITQSAEDALGRLGELQEKKK